MTGLEFVAVALVLKALSTSSAPSSSSKPPGSTPKGDGGAAGAAAALGTAAATGLATALGGGGTAAAGGGTAAAGSATSSAAGGDVVGGAGAGAGEAAAVSGEAAGFVAEGLSVGGAIAVGTFFAVIDIAIIISALAAPAAAAAQLAGDLLAQKRRRTFESWWLYEYQAVDHYLDAVATSTGTPVQKTLAEFEGYGATPVIASDKEQYWLGSYYLSGVPDPRISSKTIQDTRAVARWFAIQASFQRNEGLKVFATKHGQAPVPGSYTLTSSGATQQPPFLTPGGVGPAMLTADFWELVKEYLSQQPLERGLSSPAALTSGLLTQAQRFSSPVQKYTGWQYPGKLSQLTWQSLTLAAQNVLGPAAYSKLAVQATVMGWAEAFTYAAGVVYVNTIWPGDQAFVAQLAGELGCGYAVEFVTVQAADPITGMVHDSAQRWMLREQQLGYAIDVVGCRDAKKPVVYSPQQIGLA